MDIFGYLREVRGLLFRKPTSQGGKQVTIQPSAASDASDTTFQLPDLTQNTPSPLTSDTIVGQDAKQTLSNKTLTSPAINGATIDGTSTIAGTSGTNVAAGAGLANAATNLNTASTLVKRDASGNFLAGQITATDFIGHLQGNADTATTAGSTGTFTGTFSGDVAGGQSTTQVDQVGPTGNKKTATQIATSVDTTTAATQLNTPSTLVKRDASGNFAAGTITASLAGNATTATTSVSFSGSLTGDVTGTQSSTVVSTVGTKTATQVAQAVTDTVDATPLATPGKLVKRNVSGEASFAGISLTQPLSVTNGGTGATTSTGTGSVVLGTDPQLYQPALLDIVKQDYKDEAATIGASSPYLLTPTAEYPVQRITSGTTLGQVGGATGTGRQYILINETASDITIKNNVTANAYSIYTGTGTDFVLKSNAAVILVYDQSLASGAGRWVLAGGSGAGGGSSTVNITATGFSLGNVIASNGTGYIKGAANAASTSEVVGIISKVVTVNAEYELTLLGLVSVQASDFVDASGVQLLATPASGTAIFLSNVVAGKLTAVEPTTIGHVSVPLGVMAADTSKMYFIPKRGSVVGGTNARTQLTLTSAATTQIFNAATPSLYQAGELTGWVQLGTNQKFYFQAPFAQNGAGTDWNISPSYVGDTPPTGFSITISSAGAISATCPTFSGTGLINYALNAPAVGATFPLEISAARITQDTIAAARLPVVVPGTSAGVVAAAGLPGNTTGSVIAAGYVGEVKTATGTSTTVSSSYTQVAAVSLTPGIWCVSGSVYYSGTGGTSIGIAISQNPNSSAGLVIGISNVAYALNATSGTGGATLPAVFVTVTTNPTPYYLNYNSSGVSSGTFYGGIQAVRIA
jgi:hypothetical protein